MNVLKSRSKNPKRIRRFSGTFRGRNRRPVSDMKRGTDHHHPSPQPIIFTSLFSHPPPSFLVALQQLSSCHDLPAHPTQQQQRSSTVVRGLRSLFATHPSWAPGVLGAQGSGAVAPAGRVPYTSPTAALPGTERTTVINSCILYVLEMDGKKPLASCRVATAAGNTAAAAAGGPAAASTACCYCFCCCCYCCCWLRGY